MKVRNSQGGFTLIELLVVVSVIALLVALLLPALGAAKETARATVCIAHLQQLSVGARTYVGDNAGWWPVAGYLGSNVAERNALWTHVLAYKMGVHYSREQSATVDPYNVFPANLFGQKDNGVFQCPSDTGKNQWGGNNATSYGWNSSWSMGYGMGYNDFQGHGAGFQPGLDGTIQYGRTRDTLIQRPVTTYVIADALATTYTGPWTEDGLSHHYSYRITMGTMPDLHNEAGNYLWVDGHATRLQPDQVTLDHFDRRK